jgi:hypothetical protein
MTQRFKQLLLSVIVLMATMLAPVANAEGIKVKFFELERVESEWFSKRSGAALSDRI